MKPSWGTALPEAANPLGVTEQTCSRLMTQYGGLRLDHAKRPRNLNKGNTRHEILEALYQFRRRHQATPNSGWGGIRTHERLSPLPVFKVGEGPPGTPCTNSLVNKGETLLKPSSTGKTGPVQAGEIETNRGTTSQIETTHRTSQRQVATCRYRSGRETGALRPNLRKAPSS